MTILFSQCVYECLFEHTSVYYVHVVPIQARKGHQIPLGLELQVVVNHSVGARN